MSFFIKKIYRLSPIWLQNCFISLYGRLLAKSRYGKIYHEELNVLQSRDISDILEQKRIQNKLFLDFLNYAIIYSPFYREFYKDVDLSQIKSVDDIHLLPILDKETLRQNIDRVFSTEKKPYGFSHTGGTTGKSLSVKVFNYDVQKRMAYLDWFKGLYGFSMGQDRHARFNGKDIIPNNQNKKVFWRDNSPIHQRIYSSFFAKPDNLSYYVDDINLFKPMEMDGFCSTMYDLAKYMNDHHITPTFIPKAIFTTSETVLPHHREMLEQVFQCKVRDQYASSEGAPFIIEMPDGYMHECLDTGVFEHIKTDSGVKLIVTSFTTHGCPLIRYDIGDNIVECDDKDSPDPQIGFPAIRCIDGRKQDFLYSPEMGFVSAANMSNVIKNLPNSIVNIQFVQKELDCVLVNIVVDNNRYSKERDEPIIRDELVTRFGKGMTFPFNYVSDIKRTVGGKFQTIINDVITKQ